MGMHQSPCPICKKKHPYISNAVKPKDVARNERHWKRVDGIRYYRTCVDKGWVKTLRAEECVIGTRVIYARGAKGPLIGLHGQIDGSVDEDGLVMVKFDKTGYAYPCWVKNLERE